MANTIDYKAYLATLGKVETDAKSRIKDYLEKQIQDDDALRNFYRPEKIDDCYDFIHDAVRELSGRVNCTCIDDAVVFKMARDYFLEVLPKVAETAPEVKTLDKEEAVLSQDEKGGGSVESGEAETELSKAEETEEVPAEETENENKPENVTEEQVSATMDNIGPKAERKDIVTDEYGFEIFGEEPEKTPEEGAETKEEAVTKAETEPEEKINPADNENEEIKAAEPENEKPDDIRYDEDGNTLLFDFM